MSGWMRRRIERSRARCGRPATNPKPEKEREPDKQVKLSGVTSVEMAEGAEKGG